MLHSLLRFLSSRTDETEDRACWIAPRQRADLASVFSALRVTPSWVRVPSWHATVTINSSSALGDDRFGPKRLAERLTASNLGTAATVWSTALARDVGSSKMLAKRLGSCWRALVRARLRLPSEYPLRDRSRSQFFVDEGVASGEVDKGEELLPRLGSRCYRRTYRRTPVGSSFVDKFEE